MSIASGWKNRFLFILLMRQRKAKQLLLRVFMSKQTKDNKQTKPGSSC